eukprot:TRINITY_DN20845_c0_g1_i2.p1 TRINITY_DN20845_c0_g1~~TRINITY_DN20845_c0_g1_i2.p1  ORF type:complete len:160 (+),score=20.49 TRINITY_DN20845_c0_g1_i2:132-611(+)
MCIRDRYMGARRAGFILYFSIIGDIFVLIGVYFLEKCGRESKCAMNIAAIISVFWILYSFALFVYVQVVIYDPEENCYDTWYSLYLCLLIWVIVHYLIFSAMIIGLICLACKKSQFHHQNNDNVIISVSYTHLTLPTILLVQISVVAVSLKKKKTKIYR